MSSKSANAQTNDTINHDTSIMSSDMDDSVVLNEMSEKIARFQHLKIIFGASMYFMLILLVFVFFSRQRLKLANKKLEHKQNKLEASFKKLKEQEEEIRQSHTIVTQKREQLQLALKSTRSITWEYNILEEQFTIDSQGLVVLGHSNELDFSSPDQLMNLIHPDDRDNFLTEFANYLQGTSKRFVVEQRMIMKDSSTRWFLSKGEMVKEKESDSPIRIVGLMWDISDRKDWEKAITSGHEQLVVAKEELRIAHLELKSAFDDLKLNRQKVEFALKSAGVVSWEFDLKRNIIKIDEFGRELLPFEVHNHCFKFDEFCKILPKNYLKELHLAFEMHKKKLRTVISIDLPLRNDNKEKKWVRIKGNIQKWADNGEPLLLVGTFQDIDEGRHLIKCLQEQKILNDLVMENIPGQVVYFDRGLRIIWANKAYRMGFGNNIEKIDFYSHFHTCNQHKKKQELPLIEAMQSGKAVNRVLKGEDNRLFSFSSVPVNDENSEICGCVVLIQAIPECMNIE